MCWKFGSISLLKSSLQERFLDLLFIEERMSYLDSHANYLGRVSEKLGLETLAYKREASNPSFYDKLPKPSLDSKALTRWWQVA